MPPFKNFLTNPRRFLDFLCDRLGLTKKRNSCSSYLGYYHAAKLRKRGRLDVGNNGRNIIRH